MKMIPRMVGSVLNFWRQGRAQKENDLEKQALPPLDIYERDEAKRNVPEMPEMYENASDINENVPESIPDMIEETLEKDSDVNENISEINESIPEIDGKAPNHEKDEKTNMNTKKASRWNPLMTYIMMAWWTVLSITPHDDKA